MKRKKIGIGIAMLFLSFLVTGFVVKAEEKTEPENLYAKAAVLLDADSGRVLFGKNAAEIMPMASTTKIMTCIIALENGNLEDEVKVSAYAAGMPKVKLHIKNGEAYQLKDLLYSLMLESHNDSAVAIAEHIGGSVEGFAEMMNQKARDIGCYDTFFITPNGLDATTTIRLTNGKTEVKVHSTTAADLSKIMAYCIRKSPQKDKFIEITRTPSYNFSDISKKRSFQCNNHNAFLSMMEGALSGKTGFTGNAGYCYVGAVQREEKIFVVALLACGWPNNKTYKWSDTKKIMKYALENYQYHCFEEVKIEEKELQPLIVIDGQTDKIGEDSYAMLEITSAEGVEGKIKCDGLLLNSKENIVLEYEIKKELKAPIQKGEIVGTIKYMVDNEVWRIKQVITKADITKINFKWCLQKVIEKILV